MKYLFFPILVLLVVFTSCKKDANNPINADTIPLPPTLSTPKDTSSNIAVPVVLTWNESSGAKNYTLQVSPSSSFSSFVFNKSDISTTTQQIPDFNYLSVYYWRVCASNSAGTSDWSKVWSFITTGEAAQVPQLSLPENGSLDQNLAPVLRWNAISNANKYNLQISTNTSFTSFVFNEDSLTTTSKQVTDLSGSTKYFWRVSATNKFGTKGWSETWSFTTGVAPIPPVLLSPTDGATDVALSPTLTWNANTGATSYTLQVSTNNSFSSFVFNQSVTITNQPLTGLTNSTKYYWRVSTTNNYGISKFGDVWSFSTGTVPAQPSLLTPTDEATDISLSPTLSWNTSSGATSYILQLSTTNTFSNFAFNQGGIKATNQETVGLIKTTKYYWRVMAVNSIGNSSWSATWFFNTVSACEGTTTVSYFNKIYNTTAIGNQCWLKENLDVGTMIQGSATPSNNGVIEKYCYDNNIINCNSYGGFYQWDEALSYSTVSETHGICPSGFHIPTKVEFETLVATVNNNGNALEEIGQGSGTNTSGFSALFAGYRSIENFYGFSISAPFWSSTSYDTTVAYHMSVNIQNIDISIGKAVKNLGISIRCLKD